MKTVTKKTHICLLDIDECATTSSICGPNANCINTIGGYNCSCSIGFAATNSSQGISSTNPCTGKIFVLAWSSTCIFRLFEMSEENIFLNICLLTVDCRYCD